MATKPRNTSSSIFGRNKSYDDTKIYNDILRDVKKIRNRDAKNKYNAHLTEEFILSNLPQKLKQHSHVVYIMNEFWINNIQCLNEEELNEIAVSIHCRLYSETDTKLRELLLKSNNMSIPSHILKIITVFEYVIRVLTDSKPDSHIKLFKQLKSIGAIHKNYLNQIDSDIYELMLDAFDGVLQQKLNKAYSMEVRFCFNHFYRLIIDIMNDSDNDNVYLSRHLKQIDGFLHSLNDCLSDTYGSIYFKMFLKQQFQDENYLFYKAVEEYKSVGRNQRSKIGINIINTFIQKNSAFEVNISSLKRKQILNIIELMNKMDENDIKDSKEWGINMNNIEDIVYSQGFTERVFDETQDNIFYLMQRNSWNEFREKILEYCADDEFLKKQETKYSETLLENDKDQQKKQKKKQKKKLITKLKKTLMDDEIGKLKQENYKLQNQIVDLKTNQSENKILKEENYQLQSEIANLKGIESGSNMNVLIFVTGTLVTAYFIYKTLKHTP